MKDQKPMDFYEAYYKLLEQQKLLIDDLDYSILDRIKPTLQKIGDISNSVVSIFDLYKKNHAFHSSKLGLIMGYSFEEVDNGGEHFIDNKIHPDDFTVLMQNGLTLFKLFFNFSTDEKLNHKLVSEYRIMNAAGNYVRIIEQQQVLELDNKGNLWLALGIVDISPNQQNMHERIKSELINFRTGSIIPFSETREDITIKLTKRETEVLKLVKDGYLSKEISDKLAISMHTVNAHRQRVLEKLGVNNSMEAVMLASKLGLI